MSLITPPRRLRYENVIRRWGHALPLLMLATVLLFSIIASLLVARLIYQQQEERFQREIAAHTGALKGRVTDFTNLLVAGRAFWLSQHSPPSKADFRTYTSQFNLTKRYPDLQAMGFVEWRGGSRPRATIRYIAPRTRTNISALGYDMYTDSTRRSAIDRTRKTDGPQATEQVILYQRDTDQNRQPGFLIYLPVWRTDEGPRRLEGFVYLAVRAKAFAKSLDESYGNTALNSQITLAGVPLTPGTLENGRLQRPFLLLGQTWQVSYAEPPSFGNEPLGWIAPLMMVFGLFASGVTFSLMRRQVIALEIAEAANDHLSVMEQRQQRARAEFEAIFQSMQDAAAFTDDQGRVRLANRAMTEQFRLPLTDLVGRSLSMLHLDRRLDERGTFQAVTTPYQRADGTQFHGEAHRSEVYDSHGHLLGHLEVIRDVSERVRAEQALRSEEKRSRAILDTIPHILWVSDAHGRVTDVNTQHRLRLGQDHIEERIYTTDRTPYRDMWHRAHIQGRSARCMVRIYISAERIGSEADSELDPSRTLELEPRWYEVRVAPLLGEDGEAIEWVASATDIHDRLVAEREAQNSEARYRGVVEGMPQIVWLANKRGEITYLNRRWAEFVGAEAENDVVGKTHPDDRASYQERWATAVELGHPFEAEHRLREESGQYRAFVTRGLPIRGPGGEVIEWVGTMTDVDDSVYAENAARLLADITEALLARTGISTTRQERYDAFVALVTARLMDAAAIWIYDPEALQEEQLVQVARRDNNTNWDLPHIDSVVQQMARNAAEMGEPEYVVAHPLLHAVGVSGGVMYPLVGADGVRGVLGLAHRHPLRDRDHELILELVSRLTTALENDALRERAATAREELETLNSSLEDRVMRRTNELEEANRELEAFSYSVSHDLRTPLRHIVGFGDLLKKDAKDKLGPKGERYLNVITDAAGRMSGLIDSLLEFSRMGRQPLRLIPVDLKEVVESVWHTLEPDRLGSQVEFEVDELPSVPGDPSLLELVFQNLLSNAIKYSRTREVAVIRVSSQLEGSCVRISIQDNGVGFDPKYTAKLFGVFQRLHNAEDFDGIGIGLANVRRIIVRHGGQVSAESVLGEGATFSVTLPLTRDEGLLGGSGEL